MNQRAIVGRLGLPDDRRRRRRRLGRPGAGATRAATRACRRCRCRIRRSSSRWCAGRCTRSRSFAARRLGWGGRRAAYLSALGFAIVLLNFVPVSYFLTNSHNFWTDDADPLLPVVGISHRTAPVELRERLDFQARGLDVGAARRSRARGIAAARRWCCRPATAPRSTRPARTSTAARADIVAFLSEYPRRRPRQRLAARLRARRTSTRPGTCSASPPGSTRWSSASRRSSAR